MRASTADLKLYLGSFANTLRWCKDEDSSLLQGEGTEMPDCMLSGCRRACYGNSTLRAPWGSLDGILREWA